MKKLYAFASLSLCILLSACSTASTTHVTTYDSEGNTVSSTTRTSNANQTVEAMNKAGTAVKDGVVTGYEWTKDKTVKGYNWVKNKVSDDKAATQGQPDER